MSAPRNFLVRDRFTPGLVASGFVVRALRRAALCASALAALTLSLGCSKTKPSADGAAQSSAGLSGPSAEPATSEPMVMINVPAGLRLANAETLLDYVKATKKKGVVLNAWATWCGPCRAEMPLLLELAGKYPDLDFAFVSVDDLDKLQPVAERMNELKLPRPSFVAMPPLDEFKAGMTPRWKGSLPATFLFDPSARLRYWWGAEVFESELRPILDGFLQGKEIDGEANFKVRQEPPSP